ncbi:hypothetical protein BGW39_005613 [Mortierella sp. 14UC]|nr:hypothetical protein BGW39_005613 [Mortierella sp. 14UC]
MEVYRTPRFELTLVINLSIILFLGCIHYIKSSLGTGWTHGDMIQELQRLHQKILKDQKVSEELLKTHDIAIPRDVPEWTDTDTAFLNTVAGSDMIAGMLKQKYSKQQKFVTLAALDFAWISRKERVYKSLWNHVLQIYQALDAALRPRDKEARLQELARTRPEVDFFLRLEQRLFLWIQVRRKTSMSLHESFRGRGFVFCGGDKQFHMMVTSIQSLRLKLHSQLPIQVFFIPFPVFHPKFG